MTKGTATVYLKRGKSTAKMTFFEDINLDNQMQMGGFTVCDDFVEKLGIKPPQDTDTIIKVRVSAEAEERLTYRKGGWVKTHACCMSGSLKDYNYCPECGAKI